MTVPRFKSVEVGVIAAITFLVFGYQSSLSPVGREVFDLRYGAVPVDMWDAWRSLHETGMTGEVARAALPLLTANFLHADVMHVAGNMLFFWIFASAVSQVAGRALLVALYLLSGVAAVLVYVRTNPDSEIPMLGASGAIAGLAGAYFVFVFRWEMPYVTVWPLDGPQPPARLALVALVSFLLDTRAFFGHAGGAVAYGAHVGGFVGGGLLAMIVASVWRPRFRV